MKKLIIEPMKASLEIDEAIWKKQKKIVKERQETTNKQ
jgi:hypothetical protein